MVQGPRETRLSLSCFGAQWSAGAMVCLALAVSQTGCANDGDARENAKPAAAAVPSATAIPDPLATIDGEQITLADVRERVGTQLDQLEIQYRRARDKLIGTSLDSLLRDRLIAAESKKSGKSYGE